MTKVLAMSADVVSAACSMTEAIDAVACGFRALSGSRAVVPVRSSFPVGGGATQLLVMPASASELEYASVKVVTVASGNATRSLPTVQATVLLVDQETGSPLALLNGTVLTALRTGAAGGLAARQLARTDAQSVVLFGAGAQARSQLQGLCAVRPIHRVEVVAAHRDHAEAFARQARDGAILIGAGSPDAVRNADVVICATTSSTPVFDCSLLRPGVHVTGVGSYQPQTQELPPEVFADARVVVDQREASLAEAGELIAAIQAGYIRPEDLIEIGEDAAFRGGPTERTVFKSVGTAIQDLFVASVAYDNARARGLGTWLDL